MAALDILKLLETAQNQNSRKHIQRIFSQHLELGFFGVFFNSWPGISDYSTINQCSFTRSQTLLRTHGYSISVPHFQGLTACEWCQSKTWPQEKRVKRGDIFSVTRCKQTNKNTKGGKQPWHRWALLHVAFHT